jgi:hypothetical protein
VSASPPPRAATGGVRGVWPLARRWLHRLGQLAARRPELITIALCLAVIALGLRGPDLPAQDFRTWLFRNHGPLLWDDRWFAGHPLPGYSVVFPPLAALLGARTVGFFSCVASTMAMVRVARYGTTNQHTAALVWFAVATVANFIIGRMPFALGLALGLMAIAAVQRRRPLHGSLLAVLCSLASPLPGAFLLMAGIVWAPALGWRRALPLSGASSGLLVALAFGGGGGSFPFPWTSLVTILVFVGFGLVLAPRSHRTVRLGLAAYAGLAVVLFLIPNPVGGNLTRLGTILAGPLAALVLLSTGRRRVLIVVAGPLMVWQLAPVTGAIADSSTPSSQPAYYAGLLRFLQSHDEPLGRVEIPLTRGHWETTYVATKVPLARGWERQIDVAYNKVLYDPELTAGEYRAWLLENRVRFVAIPDATLEPASLRQAAIVEASQPWLRPLWHDAHWRVWRVVGAQPLVTGPATLAALEVSSFTLNFRSAGTADVRLHHTRFWQIGDQAACVTRSPDGWTRVTALGPGAITVTARLGLDLTADRPGASLACAAAGVTRRSPGG